MSYIDKMLEKKTVEVKDKDLIKYDWLHEKYGRAEFTFCPVFKRGKLVSVSIYPRQQETDVFCYHLDLIKYKHEGIFKFTHKGVSEPYAWMYSYCKEHKCLSIDVYVPPKTSHIRIDVLSTLTFIFE